MAPLSPPAAAPDHGWRFARRLNSPKEQRSVPSASGRAPASLRLFPPDDPGVPVFHGAGRKRRAGMPAVARLIAIRGKFFHGAALGETGRAKTDRSCSQSRKKENRDRYSRHGLPLRRRPAGSLHRRRARLPAAMPITKEGFYRLFSPECLIHPAPRKKGRHRSAAIVSIAVIVQASFIARARDARRTITCRMSSVSGSSGPAARWRNSSKRNADIFRGGNITGLELADDGL